MSEKLLSVRNLEIIYKTDNEIVHAVNNVNFELNKGEILGIVGETGAGKTTTALSLLRLLPERTARIVNGAMIFNGKNIMNFNEHEIRAMRGEKIAMIFQDPMTALNPVETVGNQIAEALEFHNYSQKNRKKIDRRVNEVMEMVGIPAVRKIEYPHQFSGGMKQRIVIAIALACEPELLIADEPTTALDVTIQAQVLALINELRSRLGTSMIMITHDLGVVAETCDNVGVMYAGEIIELGSVEDIFSGVKHHPYTDGLFGSLPDLTTKTKRLNPIIGLMPDPTDLPDGCKFSPRCPHCMDICLKSKPEEYFNKSHRIMCHLYSKDKVQKNG